MIKGKKSFHEPPPTANQQRVNERIRISPVRVIGPDGAQLGILPVEEAQAKARELGLDLVEVAANVRPVVCKIMDFGKYLFDEGKKAKEAKRRQHEVEVKEVKLRPAIDEGDFETKVGMARRFLEKGKRVKVTVMFRNRELRRPENGYKLLSRVAESLADVAEVEQAPPPRLEGRDLTMLLRTVRRAAVVTAAAPATAEQH